MEEFEDLFDGYRDRIIHVTYLFKVCAPIKTQADKETINRHLFQKYAMESLRENGKIKQLSEEFTIPEDNLLLMIDNMLHEIGYTYNSLLTRLFSYAVYKILISTMSHVYVMERPLTNLKQKMGSCPIIFVPSHRSYADFIMVSAVCYERDIVLPAIISGIDLSYMWFLSYVLKCSGAVFMRRTFNNDRLYSTVFKTYIQALLKEGGAPLEFFIEGTRSRSGKPLIPKFGCLKIIVDLFNTNQLQDILIVPISVQYDRIPEDELYAYEVLGKSKPKESTMDLLKALYYMESNKYGNSYTVFGEPISLKSYSEENKQINLDVLAHEIIFSQRESYTLTYFNVLCTVLASRAYSSNSHQFKLRDVIDDIRQLRNLLVSFGRHNNFIECSDDMQEIERFSIIHKHLISLNDAGDVISINLSTCQDRTTSTNYRPDHISLLMLQYYANYLVSFIIDAIVLISVLMKLQPTSKDELLNSYQFFRSVFKNEFVFHPHFELREFEKTIKTLNDLNIMSTEDTSNVYLKCEKSFQDFIYNLLKPFLNGGIFICELLSQNVNRKINRTDLIKEIQGYIKSKIQIAAYDYSYVYSTSSDFISNLLSSLSQMKVIDCNGLNTNDKQVQMFECKDSSALERVAKFLTTACTM